MARRVDLARMRATLVQAKVGLADLRAALDSARARLAREQHELETMRRRKSLAAGIADAQTVALAEQYEKIHSDRAAVLVKKIAAQEEELALAERDVAAMQAELKLAVATGGGPGTKQATGRGPALSDADDPTSAELSAELDALSRSQARSEREAEADRKLEELKRRMGK